MKIKGAELKSFLDEAWPQPFDDWFWDHDIFDGDPDPETVYDTDDLGPIMHQGSGEDPTRGDGYDLAKLIRRWRKERDFDVLMVTVPKARTEEIKAALAALNVKVS
ncbi:MAG: hypothetical protein F8N36_13650 [Desulfovibrio sp.]|uniref:hypothetical protein n=1 Tax=Desulfovibrio sp. TaxID=885 RepID=UPI00135F02BF|nr:hypothetical protein [Desulfovibrio sp.]MTJ93884.1 hypothetical protein [Desulfovibrio sp.]